MATSPAVRFGAVVWCALLCCVASASPRKPNIVWFLTDDQDQMLGASFPEINGVGPMPKTKEKLVNAGSMAENFYIHTPICNPSRSELLSGRYFHNIKTTNTPEWYMHVDEAAVNNNYSFAIALKEKGGYNTGMFGKYMNVMPGSVPPGWDVWMANGGGDYVAPGFQLYKSQGLVPGLQNSPKAKCSWSAEHSTNPDYGCFKGVSANYSTSVIGNVSMAWIERIMEEDPDTPFFAYIAPKAAHEPFNPAPWYEGYWDPTWPEHEPRPVNWNSTKEQRSNHGSVIPDMDMITGEAAEVITGVFKNRWRTLMSVDDLIDEVISLCERLDAKHNTTTYFFYSSDHGFQLGNFNILMDKRHVYEWNTRIHLLARGPGITPGSTWAAPATQVDMAPTFLGLAGLPKPAGMDGRSIVPFLVDSSSTKLPESVQQHLRHLGDLDTYRSGWRDNLFFEYYFVDPNNKCVENCSAIPPAKQYPNADVDCTDLTPKENSVCWGGNVCNENCYATESLANNFIAIRGMPGSRFGDTLFVEYQAGSQIKTNIDFTSVDFVEYFDVSKDQWMMNNLASNTPAPDPSKQFPDMHAALHQWYACSGDTCP